MNKERQELQEMSQSFASLDKTFKQARADYDEANKSGVADAGDKFEACMNAMYAAIGNVHQRMDRMQSSMWAYQDGHADGHLPKCPSTEHMTAAIKGLGWDKNYEVKKKQVFASKDLFEIKTSK